MTGENILIIEDDATLLRVLTDNFRHEGYTIRTACDGKQGLAAAIDFRPDLIVLDIMLPEINGYELCRAARAKQLDMPIIMLTAKGQESDIVLGLNLGADDYVTKPFSIKALLARTGALLRRRRQVEPQVVRFGECELHHGSHQLYRGGATVPLTPKERLIGPREFGPYRGEERRGSAASLQELATSVVSRRSPLRVGCCGPPATPSGTPTPKNHRKCRCALTNLFISWASR